MKNPQHILITGASSGIGEALAVHYAKEGIVLFLCGRDKDRVLSVANRCREKGAEVHAESVDVTDAEQTAGWIKRCDETAPVDLAFANAGISAGPGGDKGESAQQTRDIFAVNLGGVLNTVLPLLELMRARKRGQIALTASLAGYRGLPTAPAYSGSKNAVRAWGEALRGWLAPEGVEINVICPGFVKSRITAKNKFPMPFLMEAPAAAAVIAKGLAKNKGRIAFPSLLVFPTWLISCLPAGLADFILKKLPQKA